jgi:hypothetical protein
MQWLALCLSGSWALGWRCCANVAILMKMILYVCLDAKLHRVINTNICASTVSS